MAELADALDLGSSAVKGVQVQILFPAPGLRSYGFARHSAADSSVTLGIHRKLARPVLASIDVLFPAVAVGISLATRLRIPLTSAWATIVGRLR